MSVNPAATRKPADAPVVRTEDLLPVAPLVAAPYTVTMIARPSEPPICCVALRPATPAGSSRRRWLR
jgi:hypothetical protein